MGKTGTPPREFWSRVEIRGPEDCWEWQDAVGRDGYGHLRVEGKTISAHRHAWALTHGPIPDGLFVLHRCDNKPCVNPAHLFLGTARDNIQDCIAKGRRAENLGTNSPPRKLSSTDVETIWELIETGAWTLREIGAQFGVGSPTISEIKQGKRRKTYERPD